MGKKSHEPAPNHLKAWRKFRGLSQEALAGKLVPPSAGNTISQLENGERELSQKWLFKLADALGTTPGFLLDHDPNDIDAAFFDEALQVPKEKRGQVLQILRTFKTGTDG